ncbi:hypothetical protein [Methylibium sp.]|uniref:hypothetical protein n=1 Tax=Methylibium sp. TaxID=2067992 RepID=UPI0017A0B131|nr:hypothetical protein [Methylibium sp.]MBA3591610.1 hypothetical protein [Methylibium sp.]
MKAETGGPDTTALRAQLMAADPMQRAMALHTIELELKGGHAVPSRAFAKEVENFTARGIPFYAPQDRHFRDWVARAVSYWEKLRSGSAEVMSSAAERQAVRAPV